MARKSVEREFEVAATPPRCGDIGLSKAGVDKERVVRAFAKLDMDLLGRNADPGGTMEGS